MKKEEAWLEWKKKRRGRNERRRGVIGMKKEEVW